MRFVVTFLAAVLWLSASAVAAPQEVAVGRFTSTTKSRGDWKEFFNGDLREVRTRASTETRFEPRSGPPAVVDGVPFDLSGLGPVATETTTWTVARPGDPEFGQVRIESVSRPPQGPEVEMRYSLVDRGIERPIAVGPFSGQEVAPPAIEQKIGGKTFLIRSVSRTTEISAIAVAPTFEALLEGKGVREISDPGTHVEHGSLRVLSAAGELLGFYAGDVRVASGEQLVAVKPAPAPAASNR